MGNSPSHNQRLVAARAWLARLLTEGERAGSAPHVDADRRPRLAERAGGDGEPVVGKVAARREGGRS